MYALDVECFEPVFRFSHAAMHRFHLASNSVTVIAETPLGEMAGFVIVSLHRKREHLGYVVTLDVRPQYRRAGIAAKLMDAAEERVRDDGAEAAVLHCHSENVPALAFYGKLNYQIVERVADFYGEGLDALLLTKQLR